MQITRRSPLTGEKNTREIPVTFQNIKEWQNGKSIQDAMPNLSAEDREFIMTGYTPEDWAKMFPSEPEN